MIKIDFNSLDSIRENLFKGFLKVGELFASCRDIPDEVGVYMVVWNSRSRPEFVNPGTGGYFKRRDPNVSIESLERKWVDGTLVIYIGKAGGTNGVKWSDHTLRQRLSQYMEFGKGEPVAHRGGRYIWQLRDCKDLVVCWKPIPRAEGNPSIAEKDLIDEFVKTYGNLPFANLRH